MTEPVVAQSSPYAVDCERGKSYWWCACGRSKAQRTKAYYFCGCKRTAEQPLCDGTHSSL